MFNPIAIRITLIFKFDCGFFIFCNHGLVLGCNNRGLRFLFFNSQTISQGVFLGWHGPCRFKLLILWLYRSHRGYLRLHSFFLYRFVSFKHLYWLKIGPTRWVTRCNRRLELPCLLIKLALNSHLGALFRNHETLIRLPRNIFDSFHWSDTCFSTWFRFYWGRQWSSDLWNHVCPRFHKMGLRHLKNLISWCYDLAMFWIYWIHFLSHVPVKRKLKRDDIAVITKTRWRNSCFQILSHLTKSYLF
jgi:hypothetical protein